MLIITLNLHNKKITQRLVEKIHFLDPLHPFQFTLEDINNLLNKYGFKCIFKKRIDYLRIQLEKETAHLNNNPTEVKSNFGLMDILRGIFRKSFFILLEIFGYPRHPKTPEGKSIWAEYLLIFKLSHD